MKVTMHKIIFLNCEDKINGKQMAYIGYLDKHSNKYHISALINDNQLSKLLNNCMSGLPFGFPYKS